MKIFFALRISVRYVFLIYCVYNNPHTQAYFREVQQMMTEKYSTFR